MWVLLRVIFTFIGSKVKKHEETGTLILPVRYINIEHVFGEEKEMGINFMLYSCVLARLALSIKNNPLGPSFRLTRSQKMYFKMNITHVLTFKI